MTIYDILQYYGNTVLVYMLSTISLELCTLFQKLVQKLVIKRTSNMLVYYIIPLNYWLAGHSENLKSNNVIFKKDLVFNKTI